MAAFPIPPVINGQEYSWSSIRVNIAGADIVGVSAISYNETQEISPVYGVGNKPIARAEGNIEYTASITLHPTEVQRLTAASPTGRLQDLPPFPIVVTYQAGLKVEVHTLVGCVFKTNGREADQGAVEMPIELDLFVAQINWA